MNAVTERTIADNYSMSETVSAKASKQQWVGCHQTAHPASNSAACRSLQNEGICINQMHRECFAVATVVHAA